MLEPTPLKRFSVLWWVDLALRLGLGGFFIYAALPKILGPTGFAIQISNYQIVGDPWPSILAVSLPWLELFVGIGVCVRRLYLGSLTTILGMLVVFMIALTSLIVRNLDVECGCTGGAGTAGEALVRDAVLLGMAVALFVIEFRKPARPRAAG